VTDSKRTLLPVLLATGAGIAATPANALELGELRVQSTLGQPLRASIAYALAPNEQLSGYCVTLRQGRSFDGVPSVGDARVSVTQGLITITGNAAVTEPLLSLSLSVNCPYSARLTRDYTLFVDPGVPMAPATATPAIVSPAVAPSAPVAASAATTQARRAAPAPDAASPAARAAAPAEPIDGTRYRVQPGDTLSEIVSRIENRGVGLWSAVAQIHAANPDAFLNNDPNRLKAGSWLVIPDFGPNASFVAESAAAPEPVTASAPDAEFAEVVPTPAAQPSRLQAPEAFDTSEAVTEADAALEMSAGLQPGDVVEAVPAASPTQTLDVTLPAETAASPNVPVASVVPATERAAPNGSSLWWLIGGGVLLLGGILYFGRRGRSTPTFEPEAPEATHPMRRITDTQQTEALVADDYELDDDAPTSENLTLDADLVVGTGLEREGEMTVVEDFGFTPATALDLEFPEESDTSAGNPETDMIPAPRIEASSILESEVLPDDDDYDMSVIMDVTKVPDMVEATERDLRAVAIDSGDETQIADTYTISKEVDYQILEQDYEDELSATQALNLEIEKAAAELTERLTTKDVEITDVHEQARPPLATVTRIDAASRAAQPDDEDTDVVDTLSIDDDDEQTISEEMTARLPASDDETAEMPTRPGKVDKLG